MRREVGSAGAATLYIAIPKPNPKNSQDDSSIQHSILLQRRTGSSRCAANGGLCLNGSGFTSRKLQRLAPLPTGTSEFANLCALGAGVIVAWSLETAIGFGSPRTYDA